LLPVGEVEPEPCCGVEPPGVLLAEEAEREVRAVVEVAEEKMVEAVEAVEEEEG